MKLSTQLTLLTVTAGFLATSAFADSTLPVQKNKIYVSADAGYGSLSVPDKDLIGVGNGFVIESSHETGGFAGGVNLGINHLVRQNVLVGAELGLASNGRAKYKEVFIDPDSDYSVKIKSRDLQLLATGTYLFNNGLDVFAKAGPAWVKQKLSYSGIDLDGQSKQKVKPLVAVGAGYNVNKAVNLYVQYSHIFGKNADNFSELFDSNGSFSDVVSVDTIKAGIGYSIAI